jgi:hypothetical protein
LRCWYAAPACQGPDRRDSGEAQLEIIGKGSKMQQVLIPAVIAARLFASRGDAPASTPVFQCVRRPGCA